MKFVLHSSTYIHTIARWQKIRKYVKGNSNCKLHMKIDFSMRYQTTRRKMKRKRK